MFSFDDDEAGWVPEVNNRMTISAQITTMIVETESSSFFLRAHDRRGRKKLPFVSLEEAEAV